MSRTIALKAEIETIHELLEGLDYYTLLQIPRDAAPADVERAFRDQTRALHPDKFRAHPDADVHVKANEVFGRINEAWRTLKDADLRKAYDRQRAARMSTKAREDAHKAKARKSDVIGSATTDKGRRAWAAALQAFQTGDFSAAVLHLELARAAEPDNATFQKWLAEAKRRKSGA